MVSEKNLEPVQTILDKIGAAGRLDNGNIREDYLIPLLQDVQSVYGYLPRNAVEYTSRISGIPLSRIYGVITFYAQFHTAPRGKHIIHCCRGTACHVKGGSGVLDMIEDVLGISDGETTADQKFTLETVACLGACALAPLIVIDGEYHGEMTPHKVEKLLKEVKDAR